MVGLDQAMFSSAVNTEQAGLRLDPEVRKYISADYDQRACPLAGNETSSFVSTGELPVLIEPLARRSVPIAIHPEHHAYRCKSGANLLRSRSQCHDPPRVASTADHHTRLGCPFGQRSGKRIYDSLRVIGRETGPMFWQRHEHGKHSLDAALAKRVIQRASQGRLRQRNQSLSAPQPR